MFADAVRLFPPSYKVLAAWFPSAIHFVSRRDRFSPALLRVSQAPFPVLGTQPVTFVPESGSKHDCVFITIGSTVDGIVRLTCLPPFPATCPGTLRSWTALLCYAGCVPMICIAHSLHRRTVRAQLCSLLSMLFLNMKQDATNRFMRDPIGGCYSAERFLLLHHTMYDCRPKFSGNTEFRMLRPWSPVLEKMRVASLN
jgi:hypothetical protein